MYSLFGYFTVLLLSMKRGLLICLIFISFIQPVFARHITGGEVVYEFVSSTPSTRTYVVTLILFRDNLCVNCSVMPPSVSMGVFSNDNNAMIPGNSTGGYWNIALSTVQALSLNALPNCIQNVPNLSYSGGFYPFTITLPNNNNGYTITYQTCCRIENISNTTDLMGATYIGQIPGNNTLGTNLQDNSPQFSRGISVVCYNRPFTLDFSATDPDGDSLVYSICNAFNGGLAGDAGFTTPAPPPYGSIPYTNGYSGTQPLGPLAHIDPNTGIISGIAPGEGKYVVSVCINTYRNGQYIASHRKDFIISVAPCDFAYVSLPKSIPMCDSYTYSFSNLVSSPLNQTFLWEFGDGFTSSLEAPTHTYADTGTYLVKLYVNMGTDCADSSSTYAKVYPGFFAGINQNSPKCINKAVQFSDSTVAVYGQVNYWHWDFGVTGTQSDTSNIRNPQFIYSVPGTYNSTLIVASNKGCIDTVKEVITIIEKPELKLTSDTLICNIDTLRLNASANVPGGIVWSPNYMISNTTSLNPLVSPNTDTFYIATFTDNTGCVATDTIYVNVVDHVTLSVMPDTSTCGNDSLRLNTSGNGLYFQWSPATTLSAANAQSPVAHPVDPVTTYHVTASIGKCMANDDITVTRIPYPEAFAGRDTTVCAGSPVFLHASGGSIYEWTPNLYLNNPFIANPIANPQEDMRYVVKVNDSLGCPKASFDTVFVNVAVIDADAGPRDTSIVLNQPLQLFATGSTLFQWAPATWLSNANVQDPVSLPQNNIEYVVKVSNPAGCFDTDTIKVHLYRVPAGIYIPNAFTPTNDGRNDNFKPIALGIKTLNYFTVYNRWGQLMFTTSQIGLGWDGKYNSSDQPLGTYVWQVSAIDYMGNQIDKKGTVVLIR